MAAEALCTAGSMIHTGAAMLYTLAEARFIMPMNVDVTCSIRNTAKVMPTSNAVNFALSFTSSLYASLRIPFTAPSLFFVLLPRTIHLECHAHRCLYVFENEMGLRLRYGCRGS